MSENEELEEDMKPKPNKCSISFFCRTASNECSLFVESEKTSFCKYICSSYTFCTSKVAQAQKMRAALKDMGIED